MKERPISFFPEMKQAILDGYKNQTRRIIKDKHAIDALNSQNMFGGVDENYILSKCPYGKVGDKLFVSEDDVPFSLKPKGRVVLKIRKIRFQRLQEISEEEAKAEGVIPERDRIGLPAQFRFPFVKLWDHIYESKSFGWDVNPWVWVIEFERIK